MRGKIPLFLCYNILMKNKASLKITITVLAVAAILFGIFREEAVTVLNKAIYICLECIGIG